MLAFVQAHLDQILTIIGGILAWLIALPWAQAQKAKADAYVQANNLSTLESLALGVAQNLYASTVRTMKDSAEWNAAMKAKVLADAVAVLKTEAKEHGIEVASTLLTGVMQRAVNTMKADGAAAKA